MPRLAGFGKPTCESRNSIDIRRWHREGRLREGSRFICSWLRNGRPSGGMIVATSSGSALLCFSYRSANADWKPVTQRVAITTTHCAFGGQRSWFLCSNCNRPVALLYIAGSRFSCRRCCGLVYASQQQTFRDHLLNQARCIRMQLGGGPSLLEPFPDRPRYMHSSQYNRLRCRAEALETAFYGATRDWIAKFRQRIRARTHKSRLVGNR